MPKRAPPSRTDLIEQLYPLRLSPRPLLIRLLLRLFHPPLELLNLFLQSLLQYPLLSLSLVCEGECARGEIVVRVGESLARLCLGCDLGFGVPLGERSGVQSGTEGVELLPKDIQYYSKSVLRDTQ
jgi:hypothetical protein